MESWRVGLGLAMALFYAQTTQACEAEAACMDAYAEAMIERSIPGDYAAGGRALRDACSASASGQSCRILAAMIYRGGVPGERAEVDPLIDHACKLGDDTACNWMAERVLTSAFWTTPRMADYTEKRGWIERDCASGNDFACRKLVRYVTDQDAARYQPRCDAGETVFCALLGGPLIYPDYDQTTQAEATFRQSCAAGEGMGCLFLADLLSSGHGSDFNETQADHMQRACDLGVVHGCNVARDHMLAQNPEADRATRLRYLRPACEGGYTPACLRIASIERWDNDTTKIRYATGLRDDCLAGNWWSCDAAAYAYEATRHRQNLNQRFEDPDQLIQNFFDLAEVLKN